MSKNYIITDGPLYGHYAESDTYPVFQGKEAFRTGLRLQATGNTYTDSQGTTWVQAKTPWMVKTGRGRGLWFHSGYITPEAQVADGVAGLLQSYMRRVQGKSIDVDRKWGAQCVDLSKDWGISVFGLAPGAYGNGVDVARNISRAPGWTWVDRKERAQPGDIASWGDPYGVDPKTGEVYGHTAIVVEDRGNTLLVFQQNGFDEGTRAHTRVLDKDGLRGYARPPRPVAPPADPQTGMHTIAPGDTLWSLSRHYGVSVATLEALNPGVQAEDLRVGTKLRVAR